MRALGAAANPAASAGAGSPARGPRISPTRRPTGVVCADLAAAAMSFWLHVIVIYPLAVLGAVVVVGGVCLLIEPRTSDGCGRCGAVGKFPRYGMQQWPVCPSCREADMAEAAAAEMALAAKRKRAKGIEEYRL